MKRKAPGSRVTAAERCDQIRGDASDRAAVMALLTRRKPRLIFDLGDWRWRGCAKPYGRVSGLPVCARQSRRSGKMHPRKLKNFPHSLRFDCGLIAETHAPQSSKVLRKSDCGKNSAINFSDLSTDCGEMRKMGFQVVLLGPLGLPRPGLGLGWPSPPPVRGGPPRRPHLITVP